MVFEVDVDINVPVSRFYLQTRLGQKRCVCTCVRVCVCPCVRAFVHACVCVSMFFHYFMTNSRVGEIEFTGVAAKKCDCFFLP